MSSARHLNRPLGSIGKTLIELGDEWGESIPPIQCLVINQRDRTPGLGYGWFMSEDDWSGMTPAKRREALDDQFHLVWSYPRWGKVLEALHLKPLKENFNDLVYEASQRRGGGEGEEHRRLKMHVARNPGIVGTRVRGGEGLTEKRLPSGDSWMSIFKMMKSVWRSRSSRRPRIGLTSHAEYSSASNTQQFCEPKRLRRAGSPIREQFW
ncbi:hypothetical protein [Asaia platycodi]|uniref:hypothetical protein n=1 Tax=Asaia platycodi TaxID=610243 RepID=UPI0011DD7BC4|nr:hypothetical protein [Asaia platycodi]